MNHVSIEAAQALREKGFDLPTHYYFKMDVGPASSIHAGTLCGGDPRNWNQDEDNASAPDILSSVLWLAGKYGVWCVVQMREHGFAWTVQKRGKMAPTFSRVDQYVKDPITAYNSAIIAACDWQNKKPAPSNSGSK